MALILSCLRKIPLVDRRMRAEAWPPIPGYLLAGKTVGIVGLGRIGGEVARLCLAFNARVLATGKTLTDERAQAASVTRVAMEELFRESDIVTVHAKSNQETRGLIGDKELGSMKPGAFLINTARGAIVSEAALVRALEHGQLGGVGAWTCSMKSRCPLTIRCAASTTRFFFPTEATPPWKSCGSASNER